MQTFFCIFYQKVLTKNKRSYIILIVNKNDCFFLYGGINMKIKNMPRFITFLIILFVIVSCITNMFINHVFSHEEEKYNNITVSQGESLWSIASTLDGDVNKNIYEIKKLNHLESSMIYIGQNLIIPEHNI